MFKKDIKMAIKVKIPTPLQTLTKAEVVDGIAGTMMDVIVFLSEKYRFKDRLIVDGKLNRWVNFYRNEEDIRFLNGENTQIKDGDDVSIIPAIAGGSNLYKLIKYD